MPLSLRADIDSFVAELLAPYAPSSQLSPKVVHDPVWGTQRFAPHEMALIDSPVIQRLRRIYQLGFAYLTFPSTTQTRFEHSLGACVVATRMLHAVASRHPNRVDLDPLVGDLALIRFAALLHDCGHGFASHASEAVYRWEPAVLEAKRATEKLRDAKASEVLSWHIVTTPAFRTFVGTLNDRYKAALDVDKIADLILGVAYDERAFLGEVLNGPFDVDRVDYIVRDSEYAGMRSGVDLERFFHDIDIELLHDGRLHLVLHSTHAIEQLLWTKVHLFTRLYRHQKVLAADCLIQLLPTLSRTAGSGINGIGFARTSDYLRLTDLDILGCATTGLPPEIASLLEKIRSRQLPKRCLGISQAVLKGSGLPVAAMHELVSMNEDPDRLLDLRRRIVDAVAVPPKPLLSTVVISFPAPPPLREASQVYVLQRGHAEPVTLNSLFRIDEWLTTYTESHWSGFVFADAQDSHQVARAALSVLEQKEIPLRAELAEAVTRPRRSGAAPAAVRPLTADTDLPLFVPRLPVLEAFVQRRLATGLGLVFEGLHAVLILHFLSDLPPFLERFERLGLIPHKTWLIRKPYKYQAAQRVSEELKRRGYQMEECSAAETVEEPARRVLLNLTRTLGDSDRFLVVEDGGYLTPQLHSLEFATLLQKCVGVVEQTTKGIKAIKAAAEHSPLKVPVVSVASSKLKSSIEAAEVGDALAFSLEHYFRRGRGATLRLPALVIGFGAVGRPLAVALALRGAKVAVYDSDFSRRAEADVDKYGRFETLESLADLSKFKLVVGTTGTTSLSASELMTAADDVVLASGSSDRLEFDLAGLRAAVREPVDQNIQVDGLVTKFALTNGRSVGILCDGYPVNFVIGDGIAKTVIDPILAQLLASAVFLAEGSIASPGVHELPEALEAEIWGLYRTLAGP